MKTIEELDVQNKRVLLRLDLNAPIRDGKILDDTKIKKSIKTIKYLLDHQAKVMIFSHLGKIKSEEDKKKNSLRPVAERLQSLLNKEVTFIPETRGKELESAFLHHNLILMENTRFEDYPEKNESNCDDDLSKYWSSLGDLFINDAFGTTHRRHASNYGISKYLESGIGFLIQEEITGLHPIIKDIKRPFYVIMGGAKVDDKITLIEKMLEECDALFVGGGIGNTFLKAKGYEIGDSLYSEDYILKIKELISLYGEKIRMPYDIVVKRENENILIPIDEVQEHDCIYDIGTSTIEAYFKDLAKSATIFLNGTMGLYEEEAYQKGTEELYKRLKEMKAIKIAGGGDAVASVKKFHVEDTFDFLSTGGGATLEYIVNKRLACFEENV